MDNNGVLDFSMKKASKKPANVAKPDRSSDITSSSDSHNILGLVASPDAAALLNLSAIQMPLGEPALFAPSTGGTSSSSALLLDPTLMSTTSLALSTLYRRRRRQYSSNDEKEFSNGVQHFQKGVNGSNTEKDDAYWERRRKNNQAAKRSRDARKLKEDEIAMRAAFLEQENCKLKAEVAVLKNEMVRLHCLLFNQMQP